MRARRRGGGTRGLIARFGPHGHTQVPAIPGLESHIRCCNGRSAGTRKRHAPWSEGIKKGTRSCQREAAENPMPRSSPRLRGDAVAMPACCIEPIPHQHSAAQRRTEWPMVEPILGNAEARPLQVPLERRVRPQLRPAALHYSLGTRTTDGTLRSSGPWNTASMLLPSGSSTNAP